MKQSYNKNQVKTILICRDLVIKLKKPINF